MSSATEARIPGIILGYRMGSNRQYVNQVYMKALTLSESVHSLIGRKVRAVDSYGNEYIGKVVRVHGSGKSGIVIVVFNKNIPGQLIGAGADIL